MKQTTAHLDTLKSFEGALSQINTLQVREFSLSPAGVIGRIKSFVFSELALNRVNSSDAQKENAVFWNDASDQDAVDMKLALLGRCEMLPELQERLQVSELSIMHVTFLAFRLRSRINE